VRSVGVFAGGGAEAGGGRAGPALGTGVPGRHRTATGTGQGGYSRGGYPTGAAATDGTGGGGLCMHVGGAGGAGGGPRWRGRHPPREPATARAGRLQTAGRGRGALGEALRGGGQPRPRRACLSGRPNKALSLMGCWALLVDAVGAAAPWSPGGPRDGPRHLRHDRRKTTGRTRPPGR
jgi:hypothetical protein